MKPNKNGWKRRDFIRIAGGAMAATAFMGVPIIGQAAPKRGGHLKLGFPYLPNGADPHRWTGLFAQVPWSFCYDGLVDLASPQFIQDWLASGKPRGEMPQVTPNLAESWETTNGGKSYIFHLRKDVTFHDGSPFDADVVVWNFGRKVSKPIAAPSAVYYKDMTGVKALDKYTVQVDLKFPNASFLANACQMTMPIIAKDSLPMKQMRRPARKGLPLAAGTGPFICTEWKGGRSMSFKKWDNYRVKEQPYVDQISLQRIIDPVVRFTALRTGELDYIQGAPVEEVSNRLKGKSNISGVYLYEDEYTLYNTDYGLNNFFSMNQTKPPFNDIKVRKAFALALNYQEIAQISMSGLGRHGYQHYTPETTPFWIDGLTNWYEQDLDEAKRLMKAAGHGGGLTVEFMIATNNANGIKAVQVMQQQLRKINVNLKINLLQAAGYWPKRRKRDFEATWEVPGAYYKYDLDMISAFFISPSKVNKRAAWRNSAGYSNEEVDRLLVMAQREMNFGKRLEFYKRIYEINKRDVVYVPLAQPTANIGYRNHVKGLEPNSAVPFSRSFKTVWLDK